MTFVLFTWQHVYFQVNTNQATSGIFFCHCCFYNDSATTALAVVCKIMHLCIRKGLKLLGYKPRDRG